MDEDKPQAHVIEELAANAWPAPVQQRLDGWLLRYADGVTRRANSVLAVGPEPCYPRWLDLVTDFYSSRGLPVRFSISDASQPGLDSTLGGMGYTADGHSSVQTATCLDALQRSAAVPPLEIDISESLPDGWPELYTGMEKARAGHADTYRRIVGNIAPRIAFATAKIEGNRAGVGMAVVERGWIGLFNIATAEPHRGKGVATNVVRVLAQWGQQHGAASLYLQVMKTNPPALNLYSKLGFTHLYSYHYRSLVEPKKEAQNG